MRPSAPWPCKSSEGKFLVRRLPPARSCVRFPPCSPQFCSSTKVSLAPSPTTSSTVPAWMAFPSASVGEADSWTKVSSASRSRTTSTRHGRNPAPVGEDAPLLGNPLGPVPARAEAALLEQLHRVGEKLLVRPGARLDGGLP